MLNKKTFFTAILGAFVLAGVVAYFIFKDFSFFEPTPKEETLAEKQLKELEELRRQANIQPLTEEQKTAQLKELEALRKKANIRPLSQEQIKKQLEELEKLRQQ